MEAKLKYLEMIQNVITRMAQNSFLLKGWTVVLLSALFVLATPDTNSDVIIVAAFPALVFWLLDGYFLWQERLYRDLFDQARKITESEVNFDLSINEEIKTRQKGWFNAIISKTLLIFYGGIFASTLLAYFLV